MAINPLMWTSLKKINVNILKTMIVDFLRNRCVNHSLAILLLTLFVTKKNNLFTICKISINVCYQARVVNSFENIIVNIFGNCNCYHFGDKLTWRPFCQLYFLSFSKSITANLFGIYSCLPFRNLEFVAF